MFRMRPKRPILRAQLNPPLPAPQFRMPVRYATEPMTMYIQASNGTKTPIDPNSPQGLQLAAEVRRRKSIISHYEPRQAWTLCLPMPTPTDPGNRACAAIPADPGHWP